MVRIQKSSQRTRSSFRVCSYGKIIVWGASLFIVVLAWRSFDVDDLRGMVAADRNIARPVYGTRRLIPVPLDANQGTTAPIIEVIYSLDAPRSAVPIKGLALLLHACTHSALKFFSPSPTSCPECVGLSEELRIVRLVQERGYIPVAVTCVDTKSGCWSGRDLPRLKRVLDIFQQEFRQKYQEYSSKFLVVAIGASSGANMAAKAAAEGLVDAALVMVMGLQPDLQEKLLQLRPPLYLAPMPRDQHTLKRNRENYNWLAATNYNGGNGTAGTRSGARIILDETSCVPLPLTVEYLMQRVIGMTRDEAASIIKALMEAGHIGRDDSLFQKDPTKSDWRQVLLALPSANGEMVAATTSTEILWGKFRLTRGESPLAKAFHRAWAFHEYCSESVPLALDFFENVLM